ncbi:MAG: galactose ABC transporter substrate-binding protein [Clostridia bacterium]|nr:galactose ABC transporter substrate-binding protein [Clostridia bacterium]
MMNMKNIKGTSLLLCLCLLVGACACFTGCGQRDTYRVAVFAYKFDDSYIATVRTALEKYFKEYSDRMQVTFYNGENNQQTQSAQIDTAITGGADLLIINAVDFKSAGEALAAKAHQKGLPVIFFNREVSDAAVKTSDNICFVGTDPDAPGYMQGEQVAALLGSDEAFRKYDLNGDGKIQYAMFRAEVGNAEADGRTRYSVERANKLLAENGALSVADKKGNVLERVGADQPANWDSATANNMMGSLFRVQGGVPNIELVLCNNDDMALGVISALEAKGYNKQGSRDAGGAYIPVFGVDALATAMDAIKNGKMQGTVKQDGDAMAKAIVQIAANVMEGKDFLAGTEYRFEDDVRKLRIAYSPVNAE